MLSGVHGTWDIGYSAGRQCFRIERPPNPARLQSAFGQLQRELA